MSWQYSVQSEKMPIIGGCKPNWDIGHFPWDIRILPLSNWDIGIFIDKFGILVQTSLTRFGILGFGSYEIGILGYGSPEIGIFGILGPPLTHPS